MCRAKQVMRWLKLVQKGANTNNNNKKKDYLYLIAFFLNSPASQTHLTSQTYSYLCVAGYALH